MNSSSHDPDILPSATETGALPVDSIAFRMYEHLRRILGDDISEDSEVLVAFFDCITYLRDFGGVTYEEFVEHGNLRTLMYEKYQYTVPEATTIINAFERDVFTSLTRSFSPKEGISHDEKMMAVRKIRELLATLLDNKSKGSEKYGTSFVARFSLTVESVESSRWLPMHTPEG